MGQEVVDGGLGVGLDPYQYVSQVLGRVDVVGLAGGDEGVEDGGVLSGLVVAHKEVVLATQGCDPEGALAGVVAASLGEFRPSDSPAARAPFARQPGKPWCPRVSRRLRGSG